MLSRKVRVTAWINYLSVFYTTYRWIPNQSRVFEMGLVNITLSEKGTLMATLPANVEGDIPAIGFISHVD
ncbi:peptidase T, partial [Salmonella enterica subsp. enterica serovar Heidelberg]